MTERRIKLSFSFQRTINAHKEGHKLIIRGDYCMKDLTKEQLKEIANIKKNPQGLKDYELDMQFEELCLAAVKKDGTALKWVKDQTPEICLAAVKQNGLALEYVKDQTPEICLTAVKKNVAALEYVKDQTPEVCLAAVKKDGTALQWVKEQTLEVCLAAVKKDMVALEYVKEQTPEICLTAVRAVKVLDRWRLHEILKYVRDQTPKICLTVVKKNGLALEYVKEQTPEICLAAVKQNGRALEYVKEQTPEICKAAVKQNSEASKYIKSQIDDLANKEVSPLDTNETLVAPFIEKIKDAGVNLDLIEELKHNFQKELRKIKKEHPDYEVYHWGIGDGLSILLIEVLECGECYTVSGYIDLPKQLHCILDIINDDYEVVDNFFRNAALEIGYNDTLMYCIRPDRLPYGCAECSDEDEWYEEYSDEDEWE